MHNKLLLHILLFVITWFAFSSVSAQEQYARGYIISATGDTIQGYILETGNYKSTHQVHFKKEIGSNEKQVYLPQDIRGYTINQEKFFNSSPYADASVQKTIFLKELVRGTISLYQANFKPGNRVYFIQKGKEIPVLIPKKTLYGMLKINLTGCTDITFEKEDYKKYKYSAKKLSELIEKYNKCTNKANAIIVRKTTKPTIRGGLIGGINSSKYELIYPVPDVGHYVSYRGLSFGIYSSINFKSRISVQVELLHEQTQGKKYWNKTNFLTYDRNVQFQVEYLRIPVMARYTLPGKLRPYINAGPSVSFITSQHGSKTTYYPTYEKKEEFILDQSESVLGLNAGLGLCTKPFGQLGQISAEIRYRYDLLRTGVNKAGDLAGYQVLVGIGF